MTPQVVDIPKSGMTQMRANAEKAAAILGAMANPVRLLLLCELSGGEKSVSALVRQTSLSQSAVSQHLAKMRLMGMVATRRDGQTIYYHLASAEVGRILTTLYDVFCKARTAKSK
jgi:ArsR family transcriptional regulator, virulence genes transcriptional regulator